MSEALYDGKLLIYGCDTKYSEDYRQSFQPYQSVVITKEKALFISELQAAKYSYEDIAEICKKKWNLQWNLDEQGFKGEKQGTYIGRDLCSTAADILNELIKVHFS